VSLVLLSKRKDFQPLKSRSVSLIYVSTIGNFLYFVFLLTNKIISSNYWDYWLNLNQTQKSEGLKSAIWISCEMSQLQVWFCRPMIFFPYVLRALRLRQIWVVHLSQMCSEHGQASSKEPGTFFIKEKNLIYCMYVVLVPLAILCFISAVVPELTLLLPFFNISQCAQTPVYTTYY